VVSVLLAAGVGCSDSRPSVLLFVMDTTRADAVSAYGNVEGTTPTLDALAADGLRYSRAYSTAPWTLPSHASLFTGLLPSQHGVTWNDTSASEELVMLAEHLRDAGYETAGMSESPWISRPFRTQQGFDFFRIIGGKRAGLLIVLDRWLELLPPGRPFFLFINIVDSHAPYLVREENPYLPPDVTPEEATAVSQDRGTYVCRADRFPREMDILRGLYLGDVRAADKKLARVLDRLDAANCRDDLITIVTSDHGEAFGEQRLFDHVVGLDESLLRVPLVVHGLPGRAPAVIDETVSLASVMPSVLSWAGIPVPATLPRGPLPEEPDRARGGVPPVAIAELSDPAAPHAEDAGLYTPHLRIAAANTRRHCGPRDRVFGLMQTAIDPPFKLLRYERYPSMLVDLRSPGREADDVAPRHPEVAEALRKELAALETGRARRAHTPASPEPRELSTELEDSLRALGYLEVEPTDPTPPHSRGAPAN
jgi:arylsulfatase A-like enzyme